MAERRPWGSMRDRVLNFFDAHRDWTSVDIGEQLGLSGAYVRATLRRHGRKLATGHGSRTLGTVRRQLARIAPGARIVDSKGEESF
jgi:hypothetical protein